MEVVQDVSLSGWIVKMLLNALGLFAAGKILKGVYFQNFSNALIVAVVLAILNATLGWILAIITFPLTIITLGLFTFVVNALLIMLADYFIKGFKVRNFWWAFLLAIVLAVFNALLHSIYF